MNRILHSLRMLRWNLGHTIPMVLRHPSLFPDRPRKSLPRRLLDNLFIYLRDGAPCPDYDGLGLDLKGARIGDYETAHGWIRFLCKSWERGMDDPNCFRRAIRMGDSYLPVLQDKYLFWNHLSRHRLPVAPVFAHTLGGRFFAETGAPPLESLPRFFAKPSAGLEGGGVRLVSVRGGRFFSGDAPVDLEALGRQEDFIFQPVVRNHPDVDALNASTLNTLRLVTCRVAGGGLELFDSGFFRIGRAGAEVDNFACGGILAGVSPDGRLVDFACAHDRNNAYVQVSRHPDSGISLAGYPLPFYREAIALAMEAHGLFPGVRTIGWDVALTPDGPLIVEGNHSWGIVAHQIAHRTGVRRRIRAIYASAP